MGQMKFTMIANVSYHHLQVKDIEVPFNYYSN